MADPTSFRQRFKARLPSWTKHESESKKAIESKTSEDHPKNLKKNPPQSAQMIRDLSPLTAATVTLTPAVGAICLVSYIAIALLFQFDKLNEAKYSKWERTIGVIFAFDFFYLRQYINDRKPGGKAGRVARAAAAAGTGEELDSPGPTYLSRLEPTESTYNYDGRSIAHPSSSQLKPKGKGKQGEVDTEALKLDEEDVGQVV